MTAAKSTPARRPAAAKVPQDHKPKDEKPTTTDVDGGTRVTYRGFSVDVDNVALDDFELLGDLRSMQDKGDPSYFPSILRRLVGDDGYRVVMDGLRDESTGRVSLEAASEYINSIFAALNAKNS